MKHTLHFLSVLSFAVVANAQNPFKDIDKSNEVEVLTLSNGRYVEYFTNDTLRRIGSVMFNTVTNKVEYFIPQDDIKYREQLDRAKEPSRWLSIDPLAGKYPYASPYNFVLNNPLNNIDPDGRDVKPLTSADADILQGAFSDYSDLFYVTSYPHTVDVGDAKGKFASHNVMTTNTSVRAFEKRLAKSSLSDDQKKEARAAFQVLSSKDIVEIGVVTPASNATSDKTKSTNDNEYIGSTNANERTLLNDPNKTSETIDASYQAQAVNGTTQSGSYGFYPQPTDNQTETPQGGNYVGDILVTPSAGTAPSFGGAAPNPKRQAERAVLQAIDNAQNNSQIVTPKTVADDPQ